MFLSNNFHCIFFFWVVTLYSLMSGYRCFGRCTASVFSVEVLNVKQEIVVRTYYCCCPLNASVTTARQKEIIEN